MSGGGGGVMGNLFTISAQRGGAYYRGGLDRAFTVLAKANSRCL